MSSVSSDDICPGLFPAQRRLKCRVRPALDEPDGHRIAGALSKTGDDVYRVLTRRIDHRGRHILEAGPWQASRDTAEHWARLFQRLGYKAWVEGLRADTDDDETLELQNALAGIA